MLTLLTCTVLSSTAATAEEEPPFAIPSDTTAYCRADFPAVALERLYSMPGLLIENSRNEILFYDPCDHDPLGQDRSMLVERPAPRVDVK
jgi:hypothetical protein